MQEKLALYPLLSLETSQELCSVALLLNEKDYFETNINKKQIHSEMLLPMVDSLLNLAGIKLNSIKCVAVSAGPGSFTGLRMGMSCAKGLAFPLGIPIASVPTFDAFAFKIAGILQENSIFAIANRVNREELYYQKFIAGNNSFTACAPLELIQSDALSSQASGCSKIFGNYSDNELCSPSALDVGRCALIEGAEVLFPDFDSMEPLYVKKFIAKVKK